MPDESKPGGDDDEELELALAPTPVVSPGDQAPVLLVVDDDPAIRMMLIHALGKTYTIYEAHDGQQAREILDAIPAPDGIVCDVMMPRLDGVELAKILRKDKILQRVPILFLTAKGGAMDVVAGINAGARHYVTKPFKIADVLAKVASMTTRPKR
jgi:DNA-binding response OmpR family regulator